MAVAPAFVCSFTCLLLASPRVGVPGGRTGGGQAGRDRMTHDTQNDTGLPSARLVGAQNETQTTQGTQNGTQNGTGFLASWHAVCSACSFAGLLATWLFGLLACWRAGFFTC